MVVLPKSHKQFSKLKDITSPGVIETISSVDFEVIKYCAKVMQTYFAEIRDFSGLFDEKISNS